MNKRILNEDKKERTNQVNSSIPDVAFGRRTDWLRAWPNPNKETPKFTTFGELKALKEKL